MGCTVIEQQQEERSMRLFQIDKHTEIVENTLQTLAERL